MQRPKTEAATLEKKGDWTLTKSPGDPQLLAFGIWKNERLVVQITDEDKALEFFQLLAK